MKPNPYDIAVTKINLNINSNGDDGELSEYAELSIRGAVKNIIIVK
ncbi:hypothetical protein EU98_1807 [Prochlorococcus marinus str. MIT 9314]|uniref:Uncharacterized protein n=1 Tax=Prochlorococcus marinus str. MIT 9314 TaxID=167548 RepID=A0A0A2AIB6_PROMR|nr:hypothetical protein EU98_1807 [Prochlorococcus marinus str. MIT 9314]